MSPQSTFESMLVDQLRPHPKNIRHEVIPTDELVASIKQDGILQPLVVSPHPTLEGDYTLIAGHHWLAAAKKAGLSELPVVIRHDLDTEGKQLAAMVAENMHRTDITATEEADAYQAMLDLGEWDVKAIAKATGHKQARVKDRLKLGKLDEPQRKALDEGQLTIERALVITEYQDHPDLQEMLLDAASAQPYNWEFYTKRAKETLEWRSKVPAMKDVLTNIVGVEVVVRPEGRRYDEEYPYRHVDFETAAEAKKAGAMAIVDDECRYRGEPEYVVLKGAEVPGESGKSEEEQARHEEALARRARIQEMEDRLASLVEVETEWIRTIVSGAARSERTMRVIGRHASRPLLEHMIGWGGGYWEREYLAAHFGHAGFADDPIKEAAAKLPLMDLVTLLTIVSMRAKVQLLGVWAPADLANPENVNAQWFALRAELGWQETDVEREAKALAAELWPAAPVDEDEGVAA